MSRPIMGRGAARCNACLWRTVWVHSSNLTGATAVATEKIAPTMALAEAGKSAATLKTAIAVNITLTAALLPWDVALPASISTADPTLH